jgi:hypothetical protein
MQSTTVTSEGIMASGGGGEGDSEVGIVYCILVFGSRLFHCMHIVTFILFHQRFYRLLSDGMAQGQLISNSGCPNRSGRCPVRDLKRVCFDYKEDDFAA